MVVSKIKRAIEVAIAALRDSAVADIGMEPALYFNSMEILRASSPDNIKIFGTECCC